MTMLTRTAIFLTLCLTGCSQRAETSVAAQDSTPVVPVSRAALANLANDIKLTAEFQP
jgi:hypothetical protein